MLVDSGSSHSFINDQLALQLKSWKKLANSVHVQVANGEKIACTHELVDQTWGIQGHSFCSTFKILPLSGYDIILGMDQLSLHSPMHIHWAQRWMKFSYNQVEVKLQGITSATHFGPPLPSYQLQALDTSDSILYLVQLQPVQSGEPKTLEIRSNLQPTLEKFQGVFSPPSELPLSRSGDHRIPLLEGTQPFCLWPYRYNPAQKDKIESQIKDLLAKGWIQPSTSLFASPALLVKKKIGDWCLCVVFRRC